MTTSTLHVLIVDDSPEDRAALRRLLAKAGPSAFTVSETTSGDRATEAYRKALPDCVLLDYRLPDQEQALEALRALADLPVVLLTGEDGEGPAVHALQHGAQDYLLKSALTPQRLALTLRRAVEVVRLRRQCDKDRATQRQAAALQQQHEQWFRLSLDAARLAAWDWDAATGTITFTEAASTHFGLRPDQLTRTMDEWIAAIYAPDRPRYMQAVTAAMTTDHVYQLQLRVHAVDGRLIWIEVHGTVLRDADGRPARLIGVVHDISAEKRRELAQAMHAAISQVLSRSLDLAAMLQAIARLPLPDLADYCAIHLHGDDGVAVPVASMHVDPVKQALLAQLQRPVHAASDTTLLGEVLRTGKPRLLATVSPELLAAISSGGPAQAAPLCGQFTPRSALIVPLEAAGRILGVLRLGITESERHYDEADLQLAGSLARRCAEAIHNARLHEATLQAQRRQAEALAQLTTLIANAPIGIAFLDTELRYLQVNAVLATLNCHAPEAHIGRHISEVIPAIAPQVEAICRQVLVSGEPVLDREDIGAAVIYTGVQRVWLSSYFPVRGPDGAILGVGTLVNEITERRLAAQELERQRQQLEAIVQTVQEGVLAFYPDGRLVTINSAAWRLVELDDLKQPRTWLDVVEKLPYVTTDGSQILEPDFLPIQRVLRGERFTNLELCLRHEEQPHEEQPAEIWLSFSGAPAYDADGALVLGVVTAHNITQRKHDEAALREQTEALSRTNAELARALRLKSEFLAMMSHELRTPLNVVLGITEALNEGLYGALNERQHKALTTVAQSGRHLLAILADILDLARIEAGAETLELQSIDIESLCQSALQFVRSPAHQKGLRLLHTVERGVEGLRADERRLTQILVNLLDNAVKFTPAGGAVGLEVTADAAHEIIQLTVWDTGIGIAAADIERLFQPFTQVDAGLSRQYGGIGLGLTLVRRLVELHGGSISLSSEPNRGSRFTISLRWPPRDNAVPVMPGARTRPLSWARPPHVLFADDHEITLALYSDLLTHHGCLVTTARAGDEALDRVYELRPDLVVLDLQMPGMDGLTVIRRIRASPSVADVPIIALTALAMPGDQERCLAAGATRYLAKPASLRTLLATIAAVLPATPD
ncbi:MAG: response regulator [Chloroflexales bacterium]|nr:response regulator [Chloroflexales bacterium]